MAADALTAATGASDPLLLLLHGRGGRETDLAWLADDIPPPWEPHALRGPLPLHNGFEWFAVGDMTAPGPLSADVGPAADHVLRWIDAHASERRVGVVGYSQGGAVAVQMLRRAPQRLAFAAIIAGFTTIDDERGDAELARRRPPVLWVRGALDRVILATDVERMQRFLPSHVRLEERVDDEAGHDVTAAMAADVLRFIRAQAT